jgi:hypothetical protein
MPLFQIEAHCHRKVFAANLRERGLADLRLTRICANSWLLELPRLEPIKLLRNLAWIERLQ